MILCPALLNNSFPRGIWLYITNPPRSSEVALIAEIVLKCQCVDVQSGFNRHLETQG